MQAEVINVNDPQVVNHMCTLLSNCLEADAGLRSAATNEWKQHTERVDKQSGLCHLLLLIVSNASHPMHVRHLAAAMFKNLAKKQWDPNDSEQCILSQDKELVKTNLFQLMLSSENTLRKTLSEAIRLICDVDFPSEWQSLVPSIVESIATDKPTVVIHGALSTAHSVFQRYRKESELTTQTQNELLAINAQLVTPLLKCMQQAASQLSSAAAESHVVTLNLCTEVFYDCTVLDMGQEHVDNLDGFMNVFLTCLVYDNPALKGTKYTPGPIQQMKAEVLNCLTLFLQKYDEEFSPFVRVFLEKVWELLKMSDLDPASDEIVISSMEFMAAACRGIHADFLADPQLQKILCETVIMPNITLRDTDAETFEDEPQEYIERDIEGSDLHTRRRSACDLTRALTARFESVSMSIFQEYGNIFLQKYQASNGADWKSKDAATYLVTALAIRGSTSSQRDVVVQLNASVPVMEFFTSTVAPDLDPAAKAHHILVAAAIKFVATFRHHIPADRYPGLLQQLSGWLSSPFNVVRTYASHTINRLFMVKDNGVSRVSDSFMQSAGGQILASLCHSIVSDSRPNEYAMQCLMRCVRQTPVVTGQFAGDIINAMAGVLAQAAKNPTNPYFNHHLFEVFSSTISCAPQHGAAIEGVLWQTLMQILQSDVVEFLPYTLQILAQLLDSRADNEPVPDHYMQLLPPLLRPEMYEQKGNIPAIVRLIMSFVRRGAKQIESSNQTTNLLGVFQLLLSTKRYDHEGFNIVIDMVANYPRETMDPHIPTIFKLMLQRLSGDNKTPKYIRCIIIFFSLFVILRGPDPLIQIVDSISTGVWRRFLENVWLPNVRRVTGAMEKRWCAVALISLACDSSDVMNHQRGMGVPHFCSILTTTGELIFGQPQNDSAQNHFTPQIANVEDLQRDVSTDTGFSNVYCPLQGAAATPQDPCATTDVTAAWKQKIGALLSGPRGPELRTVLQQNAPSVLQSL